MSTSINQTYTLAHTAQCKLKIAANRPDRNLRFLIGHAFTYDKLMLKIVEIEERGMRDPVQELPKSQPRRISFGAAKEPEKVNKSGRKSPPPRMAEVHADDESDSEKTDSDNEVFDDYDEEDAGGLNLSKTTSHIAEPPSQRQPEPEPEQRPTHVNQFDELSSSSEEEDDEQRSPITPPTDAELAVMMKEDADGDEALAELYESVRRCSCHGVDEEKAPRIERAWEVPAEIMEQRQKQQEGVGIPRVAVVQVAA